MKTKSAEGDPAALRLTDIRLENFVGEEAPVARAGPRNPDVFYRGEEAGAAPKTLPREKTITIHTSKLQANSQEPRAKSLLV